MAAPGKLPMSKRGRSKRTLAPPSPESDTEEEDQNQNQHQVSGASHSGGTHAQDSSPSLSRRRGKFNVPNIVVTPTSRGKAKRPRSATPEDVEGDAEGDDKDAGDDDDSEEVQEHGKKKKGSRGGVATQGDRVVRGKGKGKQEEVDANESDQESQKPRNKKRRLGKKSAALPTPVSGVFPPPSTTTTNTAPTMPLQGVAVPSNQQAQTHPSVVQVVATHLLNPDTAIPDITSGITINQDGTLLFPDTDVDDLIAMDWFGLEDSVPATPIVPDTPAKDKKPFSLLTSLMSHPEVILALASHLEVQNLVDLFAISKTFHFLMNSHYTTFIRTNAERHAPRSSFIFPWRCYKALTIKDPMDRRLESNPLAVRDIPGLKWLRMVTARYNVCIEIIESLRSNGFIFPNNGYGRGAIVDVLRKLWFTMDLPQSHSRIGVLHNAGFWTDKDIFLATLFLMKLDMRFTDPIECTGELSLRELLMGCRNLIPLRNMLTGKARMIHTIQLKVWYDYQPSEANRGMDIFGVGKAIIGQGCREGWGRGIRRLIRPDEAILREGIRRNLMLHNWYLDFVKLGVTKLEKEWIANEKNITLERQKEDQEKARKEAIEEKRLKPMFDGHKKLFLELVERKKKEAEENARVQEELDAMMEEMEEMAEEGELDEEFLNMIESDGEETVSEEEEGNEEQGPQEEDKDEDEDEEDEIGAEQDLEGDSDYEPDPLTGF
ncbi:hypothetical protein EJ08DRAFT_683147 [Tothia fuscella]|uniref:F-box domain-containing protein n=1 Tax=Tothia fuscella TaxID=1048955 RepID=A0A9P4NGY7_9PEZI|nr:hypothetical protein EJ08DRAFT_683147 [Tothia fuscella]